MIVFFCLAIKHSIGNVVEIINLLDKDKYTGQELVDNYQMLINKWGEWEIIGNSGAGLSVRYVNVGKALFSGLAITYATLTLVMLVLALTLGKLVFPILSKHYASSNEELVDMATLKSAAQIDEMHKAGKSKSPKEWF